MPSSKAGRFLFGTVIVAVVVIVSLFVWPGFLNSTSCTTESINGRTYCSNSLVMPSFHGPPVYANQSFRGYTFEMEVATSESYGLFTGLYVTVIEPNGTSYLGSVDFLGPGNGPLTDSWFTPDNLSGVSTVINSGIATLLVIG